MNRRQFLKRLTATAATATIDPKSLTVGIEQPAVAAAAGPVTWAAKSPEQILADINAMLEQWNSIQQLPYAMLVPGGLYDALRNDTRITHYSRVADPGNNAGHPGGNGVSATWGHHPHTGIDLFRDPLATGAPKKLYNRAALRAASYPGIRNQSVTRPDAG